MSQFSVFPKEQDQKTLSLHGALTFLPKISRAVSLMLSICCLSSFGQVVINELSPSNRSTLIDEEGEFSDWLELHNLGDSPVDLKGWGLTDSPKRPFEWVFQTGEIPPDGYLVVFASGKDRQPWEILPISPDLVEGLKLWLAADQIRTDDPDQIRQNGSLYYVKNWIDQSGSGNNARQLIEQAQPLLVTNSIINMPVLRFDGFDDVLVLSDSPATNVFTIWAVFYTHVNHENDIESDNGYGGTSGQHWLFASNNQGPTNAGSGISVGLNGIGAYEHGDSYIPALAVFAHPISTNFNVISLTYKAKRPVLRLQGATVRTGLHSSRENVIAPTQIGAGIYGAFNGDLAEVIVFGRALNLNEKQSVDTYLAQKYSISFPRSYHTTFKLSASGDTLVLTSADGSEADRIKYPSMVSDISIGRKPDGNSSLVFFRDPTPGYPNTTESAAELLPPVELSLPGGFYKEEFDLKLRVGSVGASIYFTLDGSYPTTNSLLYTNPIPIKSMKGVPNDLSTIPTILGGLPPLEETFKGTVVRAKAFKDGALSTEPVSTTYFIDPDGRQRYSLPVVSIITDKNNFFDSEIGIYIPGKTGMNYSMRGDDWERPVFIELYEADNSRALSKEAGVAIHGNTSQGLPIKALDFNANGGSGRGSFKYRIFPDRLRDEYNHFLLRPSGQDQVNAFMRDEVIQSIMSETGAETQASKLWVTFVNGEYWGLSYAKEKEDEEFISSAGNVPEDGIDLLEGYVSVKAGDTLKYQELLNFVSTNDMSATETMVTLGSFIDVRNFIDYKAAEIFFYRWDIFNHRLWRPKTPDGRWRWLQFDNDTGFGGYGAIPPAWNFNMLAADLSTDGSLMGHNTEETTFLLRKFCESGKFRTEFINRFADLLNSVFLPSVCIERIDQFAAILEPEMAEHISRWRNPKSLGDWQQNVENMREFARKRPDSVRLHIQEQFGLAGTSSLSLAVSNPSRGMIRVNSLVTAAETNSPWSGVYFNDIPITIKAEAFPGYRFARWQGIDAETETLTLVLTNSLEATAIFESESESVTLFATVEDQVITLNAQGPRGATCKLLSSSNAVNWDVVTTLTLNSEGKTSHLVSIESSTTQLFFQVRLDSQTSP